MIRTAAPPRLAGPRPPASAPPTPWRPSVTRARIPAPIAPDVSRVPVHPENVRAPARPAPIQRCGIGSSCDCPPHEKLAGVQRDLAAATSGGGAPLPHATRDAMERRFASDFAAVRVHTGAGADQAATALRARALTSGTDIMFRSGAYRPGTPGGDRLLAHELTHVLQQRSGPVPGTEIGGGIAVSDPSDRFERQAESAAGQLVVQRDDADKPSDQPAGGQCVPDPGIPSSDCGLYLANAYWLPLAYVLNATCACNATPNVPTANCVRKFLQDRLRATPGWLIAAATAAKALPPGEYEPWVQAFLTPRIYSDHVDAYRHCCCPSGPAPYPDWMAVTTVPILPCSLTGWFINHFGSCSGTPGAW